MKMKKKNCVNSPEIDKTLDVLFTKLSMMGNTVV